jgi:hypothetical protein
MTQHFTRNTVSAEFYCGRCEKFTQHRIDGGRKGPCLGCIARLDAQHEAEAAKPPKSLQQNLFPVGEPLK